MLCTARRSKILLSERDCVELDSPRASLHSTWPDGPLLTSRSLSPLH
jgi:hypothetical protein